MLHMELGLVAAEFESGQLYAEKIPAVATTLLASGADSPSLRLAAGADQFDPEEQRALFRSALVELGALPLSARGRCGCWRSTTGSYCRTR
jgi:hypothetical protein